MSGRPAFEYHEAAPPREVERVVHSLWGFWTTDAAPDTYEHTILPDGCVSIGVAMTPGQPALFICVPAAITATSTTVRRGSRFFGLRLWPDTARVVLGAQGPPRGAMPPAPMFTDAGRDLVTRVARRHKPDDIWRAISAWCLDHVSEREPPDAIVRETICAIIDRNGDVSSTQLAKLAGLGPRQLQRRFSAATGLTIKNYARVRRMRSALGYRLQQRHEAWSMTAAATGFADQAHLTREFTSLTGLAPRQVERHLSKIGHRNVTP